jgi:hypothetical protein
MDKRSNEICLCMGQGIQSPSLRALIDMVEKAELKARAEAQSSSINPAPSNEQKEPHKTKSLPM